jgi:hypothetical protein
MIRVDGPQYVRAIHPESFMCWFWAWSGDLFQSTVPEKAMIITA